MRTRASATSSSSAAIRASAVTIPWPSSTLPVKTVTVPAASMRSQVSRSGLRCRLGGITARELPRRAPHRPQHARLRAAAAQVTRERLAHLGVARRGVRSNSATSATTIPGTQ